MRGLKTSLVCGLIVLALTGCSLLQEFPTGDGHQSSVQSLPESTSGSTAPSPSSIVSTPVVVPRPTDSTEVIARAFAWTYEKREWTWDIGLSKALYDFYRQLPRTQTPNYSVYVTHPLDDAYIDGLATKIRTAAGETGYNEYQIVELAAAFVQSLPYTYDIATGQDEYPRYPIETLVDNGGDCEDTSILMASMLRSLGYGVVLLVFAETPDSPGHVAVGVAGGEGIHGSYWEYKGRKYYYLETTGDGWLLGQIPEVYANASATVYDMVAVPILTHEWTSNGVGSSLTVSVVISNHGTATTSDVYVYAGFDAGNDQVWNSQQSQPFNIAIGQEVTVTLILNLPDGKHTRLIVQIVDDGHAVDESHSEWFDS
jgi:predicted transglutaminase-like cysteine proteinase